MKKKNALSLLLAGVMFLLPPILTGCDQRSSDLSFTRGEHRYVVDPQTGKVSVFSQNGVLLEIYHSPAAGEEAANLPSAIIHYLLLGNGSVSGLVWNDRNGNQKLDPDEGFVPEVRVYIDTDNNETYSPGDPFELTDGNGFYTFSRIKPGTTNIFIDTDTLPVNGGYEFTTSHPLTVNLARKQAVADADFGVRSEGLPAELDGTIWDRTDALPIPGVRVYVDLNNDDKFTAGEPNNYTDASGNYQIADLPGGTFKVHADNTTMDVKYHRTPVQGANPTMVTFASGTGQTVSLAYIHKATICGALRDASGRLWGNVTIYIDLNNNGAYDNGEPMTVTDGSGKYCFDELMPGEYTLRLLANPQWDGYTITSPGLLTVGEGDASSADFLLQAKPATIAGTVWDDANGSSLRETGEKGLAGVTVFLDANNNGTLDPEEASMATDENGAFSFANLQYGNFYIRVDDSGLQDAFIPTTVPNPLFRPMGPGQTFDGAKFGYQRKLALMHIMSSPTRLAWGSDGSLYVSDNLTGSVFIYDSTLTVQGELKGMARPLGVATDGTGNIYVGNQGRKNVEVYSPGGTLLRTIGAGEILTPNDIAVDRDNNVYILDSTGKTVLVYDQEGNYQATISSSYFKFPVSVAINYRDDGTGTEISELYVADQPGCAIHIFALDGTYKRAVGASGTMYTSNWDAKFSGLVAVDIDQNGNIHGLDNNLNVVQVFEPQNGTFVRSYNAYPPENEYRINLQTDFSINRTDSRVVISNFETKNIEQIAPVTAP